MNDVRSTKVLLITAACAGVITGLSVVGNFAAIGFDSPGRRLAAFFAAAAVPGQIVVMFLGIGHGAHGFPSHADVAPYALSFLFWWALLYFGYKRWARRNAFGR